MCLKFGKKSSLFEVLRNWNKLCLYTKNNDLKDSIQVGKILEKKIVDQKLDRKIIQPRVLEKYEFHYR